MPLVDPGLVAQYAELHRAGAYGNTSLKRIARIRPLVRELDPASILDYGCGQSSLVDHLALRASTMLYRYDPAIPEIAEIKAAHVDMIVCTDVLEHIPEADLPDVLHHIAALSSHVVFGIDTTPSEQQLPDGSNAHCTVRPAAFWHGLLRGHFDAVVRLHSSRSSKCWFKTWRSAWYALATRVPEFLWLASQRKLLRRYRP